MRCLVLALALLLAGCGIGYQAPQATLRIEFNSVSEMDAASTAIQGKLNALGFHVQRRSQGLTPKLVESLPQDLRQQFAHTLEFWLHNETRRAWAKEFHGDLVVYPGPHVPAPPPARSREEPPYPFLELNFSELRPGGFSSAGLELYRDIHGFLLQQGYAVRIVTPPPPTDNGEYYRITITNFFAVALWWLASWTLSALILCGAIDLGLRQARARLMTRQIVCVVVAGIFVTPLPVPTMFLVLFVPNLFVMLEGPAGYAALFEEYGGVIPAVFAVSCVAGVAVAMLRIRGTAVATA